MVQISGNTYSHKETIKSLGFRWNSRNKTWTKDSVSEQDMLVLQDLRGLIIENGATQIDTRSHKEKYGQCEDAPCCGCCGSSYYGTAGYDY